MLFSCSSHRVLHRSASAFARQVGSHNTVTISGLFSFVVCCFLFCFDGAVFVVVFVCACFVVVIVCVFCFVFCLCLLFLSP